MNDRTDRKPAAGERRTTGFLVVDKPAGWTSHAVVDAARNRTQTLRAP